MLSWTIGDVKITRVDQIESPFIPTGGKGPMGEDGTPDNIKTIAWLVPHFANEHGHVRMSVHALLVEAPGMWLVVDTCVGNDKPRGNPFFNKMQTAFLDEFAKAGWTRERVDAVVCTHMHVDHVRWNTMLQDGAWIPTFPNARYLLGKTEWAHWSGEDDDRAEQRQILSDSVQPLFDAGLVDLVETDHRISDHVRLIPTPGHTPGHVSVVIESRGERAVITGDAVHHPCQIAHPEWSSGFDSDQSLSRRTRRDFLAQFADDKTLVIGTHFASPTAGRLVRVGEGYRLLV